MKIIAFHLPQFHEIKENNEWWGEAFTEWTNVKKSLPLFEGHNQPRIPLNNNYYNMLDESTRDWQSSIARDHGLFGFCYYHYWFKGKKLLDKPIEDLISSPTNDMPFCLCWANESWSRRWDGKEKEILIKQEYGEVIDWEDQFDYLKNFFLDERYIKVNNMPMYLIYRTEEFDDFYKMLNYWGELAKKIGFSGIHFVQVVKGNVKELKFPKEYKAIVQFEPFFTLNNMPKWWKLKERVRKLWNLVGIKVFKRRILLTNFKNYEEFYRNIISRKYCFNKITYNGSFIDWDNTPRRGYNGLVFKGSTPAKFQKYLSSQLKSSSSEFLFINAWNEWCEGTYLEPDEKNGFAYLEAVKKALNENKSPMIG